MCRGLLTPELGLQPSSKDIGGKVKVLQAPPQSVTPPRARPLEHRAQPILLASGAKIRWNAYKWEKVDGAAELAAETEAQAAAVQWQAVQLQQLGSLEV